ncbi:hypothetical protein F5J12DRAFT_789314 [Pisolithus orientalis]|uniref:uncharacterized protein n=1 Tax=Pisolithus orientalis TaxID=936130 RepID=UPI00222465FC|nr:uncharacterized protein F5J12DRAFT_789314 [Pisolithus orientalis]KAI5980389.1 hypothetical protein F5J12DRAFT_789314 [Pisolithus orientalis]
MQEAIDAQVAAIQQAHAQVREMETAMEVRQVIQGAAKAKPVRPRQAPASRDPGQEIGPPVATETRQAIQVTAKVKSVRPRQGPVSLQGKPGNIVIQPHGEVEVADMEVNTHQVTAPAIADYTSNKPQSGRTASCMLRRQGAVTNLDLLANVASTHGSNETSQQAYILIFNCLMPGPSLGQGCPNWADATIQQTTNFHPFFDKQSYYCCQLQYKPSIPGSVIFNIFNQGKMPAPTHCMDKEELEDQPAFSVKVVGHDKFKVVTSTANDIESNNEFNQLIFEEAQTGSKCKYLDHDNTNYVTSSKVEDFDDEYFDVEDHNLNSCMLPAKELCVVMTDNGVDEPKKSKVDRDADQESGQRCTTAGQAPSTRTMGKASKHSCYRSQDLPSVLMAGKMGAKEIMPALLVWAGSLADPWTISDEELIWSLQIIILTIAPDFEDLNDVCPGTAVFNIVLHVNDSASGTATLDPLQSLLLLTSLSQIQKLPCADSSDVPKLKIRELKNTGIKGALALTCAALHHTLSLFKTGKLQIDTKHMSFRKAAIKIPLKVNKVTRKELSAVSAFSKQNCGPCTRQYAIAITKCDNTVLCNIIMGATMLIPYSMDCMSEGGSFQHGEDNINNLIATLCTQAVSFKGKQDHSSLEDPFKGEQMLPNQRAELVDTVGHDPTPKQTASWKLGVMLTIQDFLLEVVPPFSKCKSFAPVITFDRDPDFYVA